MAADFLYATGLKETETQTLTLYACELQYFMIPRAIETPLYENNQHFNFFVTETATKQVLVHISMSSIQSAVMGEVFISDSTGNRLKHVLSHNVISPSGYVDLMIIPTVPGIILSNVYNSIYYQMQKRKQNNDLDQRKGNRIENIDEYKQTKISFNNGATWDFVKPPETDLYGKPYEKEEDISLHLHLYSSQSFVASYTVDNALGLVLAHGNVGTHLRDNDVGIFLSRDGGLQWYHIGIGKYIYEIGDRGGLIVMAKKGELVDSIEFSWNYGYSFRIIKFSKKKIFVDNIITETENEGKYFMLLGHSVKGGKENGVTVRFDFSGFHERNCRGYKNPKDEDSDYELWEPKTNKQKDCVLGIKTIYVRRKDQKKCFSNHQSHVFHTNICKCTEEDWVCDVGYERDDKFRCRTKRKDIANEQTKPEKCQNYYLKSRGYIKVAGDQCVRGVDHSPFKITCGWRYWLPTNRAIISFALIGFILFLTWKLREQVGRIFASIEGNLPEDFKFAAEEQEVEYLVKEEEDDLTLESSDATFVGQTSRISKDD